MFTLAIETENAAFEDAGSEVARILRKLADKVQAWPGANHFTIGLRDLNGNKVGTAQGNPTDTPMLSLMEG